MSNQRHPLLGRRIRFTVAARSRDNTQVRSGTFKAIVLDGFGVPSTGSYRLVIEITSHPSGDPDAIHRITMLDIEAESAHIYTEPEEPES